MAAMHFDHRSRRTAGRFKPRSGVEDLALGDVA